MVQCQNQEIKISVMHVCSFMTFHCAGIQYSFNHRHTQSTEVQYLHKNLPLASASLKSHPPFPLHKKVQSKFMPASFHDSVIGILKEKVWNMTQIERTHLNYKSLAKNYPGKPLKAKTTSLYSRTRSGNFFCLEAKL